MCCVGFEPTIPASEREKTVHALDRAATVTGVLYTTYSIYYIINYNGMVFLFVGYHCSYIAELADIKFCLVSLRH
jgi:hypothetical protein